MSANQSENYQKLLARLDDIFQLNAAAGLLAWDQQVNMPAAGAQARGAQLAVLARLSHELFTADETARLLEAAAVDLQGMPYDSDAVSMLRVVQRDYALNTRFPAAFVAENSRLQAEANPVWAQARAQNNFAAFQPYLERMFEMARQAAEYLGYAEHPYDALLDRFEQGMTASTVKALFEGHKPALVELVAAIQQQPQVDDSLLHQPFAVDKQRQFARQIVETMGFDFARGREDLAVHPFASGSTRNDVRLTLRVYPDFFNPAFFGLVHEAGHGMYEQGIGESVDRTFLGGGTSLGVHESQSRMWENIVGRSQGFWSWALPLLKQTFPQLGQVTLDQFYRAINKVEPSFIRVEADEATYNLHIMLRFEIEMGLLDGSIRVADLPQEWSARFDQYFGIVPPNDAEGVLQDIHWSIGLIGYYPTYALGNLLSVQYYNQALKAHPAIPEEMTQGKFDTLRRWLNENIHQHGRKFTSGELTQRVTGESIQYSDYLSYLKTKYSEIYRL